MALAAFALSSLIAPERYYFALLVGENPLKCRPDRFGQIFQIERLSEQEVIAQGAPKA